jgi:hypothetical protein
MKINRNTTIGEALDWLDSKPVGLCWHENPEDGLLDTVIGIELTPKYENSFQAPPILFITAHADGHKHFAPCTINLEHSIAEINKEFEAGLKENTHG